MGNMHMGRFGNEQPGVRLLLKTGATYYWSVKAVDAGLRAGSWSVEQSTCVTTQVPNPINNLVAVTEEQLMLSWTSPYGDAASYELRYSTYQPITNGTEWSAATVWSQNWTPLSVGNSENKILTGLMSDTSYYFAIKSTNAREHLYLTRQARSRWQRQEPSSCIGIPSKAMTR